VKRSSRIILGTGAGIVILALVAWGVLAFMRRPHLTAELRGQRLARDLGCVGCHGPGGTGGVPNPGSDAGEVPAWDGGTAMMYVNNVEEVREWILDGHPKRLAEKHEHEHESGPHALPVEMPAFRDVVSDDELEDLVAYYRVVARYPGIPDSVRAGYDVARRSGCFGCHGKGGLVGAANPRSFKGYIPPWRGPDFEELVRDEGELRAWIQDGNIERLEGNRAARWFMRRAIVEMPAYRKHISDGELQELVGYINWLNRGRS
jgi:mono/diheme cytochrome c family protein